MRKPKKTRRNVQKPRELLPLPAPRVIQPRPEITTPEQRRARRYACMCINARCAPFPEFRFKP